YGIGRALSGGEGRSAWSRSDCGGGSESRRGRWPAATGELERPDACLPAVVAGGGHVLVGVPEGAVVHRVYRHVAVVSPPVTPIPIYTRLRTSSGDKGGLALPHCAEGVGCQSTRVPDGRVDGAARHVVTQRHVSGAVHGDA